MLPSVSSREATTITGGSEVWWHEPASFVQASKSASAPLPDCLPLYISLGYQLIKIINCHLDRLGRRALAACTT